MARNITVTMPRILDEKEPIEGEELGYQVDKNKIIRFYPVRSRQATHPVHSGSMIRSQRTIVLQGFPPIISAE